MNQQDAETVVNIGIEHQELSGTTDFPPYFFSNLVLLIFYFPIILFFFLKTKGERERKENNFALYVTLFFITGYVSYTFNFDYLWIVTLIIVPAWTIAGYFYDSKQKKSLITLVLSFMIYLIYILTRSILHSLLEGLFG